MASFRRRNRLPLSSTWTTPTQLPPLPRSFPAMLHNGPRHNHKRHSYTETGTAPVPFLVPFRLRHPGREGPALRAESHRLGCEREPSTRVSAHLPDFTYSHAA